MAFLYVGSTGKAWRKHSYSAGNDYDQSPLKYYLRRVMGWREKDNKARFLFGKALELAIQWHHDHNGEGAVDAFVNLWSQHKERNDLLYTQVEKDWNTLLLDGIEMIKLYIIKQPSLPIPLGGCSAFQREYKREVFPGDPVYGEIEDAGICDIVSYVDPEHPMLEKFNDNVQRFWYNNQRPVIIDIKTSGTDFPEQPGIASFDKQLRRYSWQSGIRDVALLGFRKVGRSIKKGNTVTLLIDTNRFKAGDEVVVSEVADDIITIVRTEFLVEEIKKYDGRTKEGKRMQEELLELHSDTVRVEHVTRQRLQYLSGYVTEESANEAGEIAARQIVQIVNSWKNKSWPNTFGIRYPQDDRSDPYFRAFVLGDERFKQENFSKIDEENFNELLEDEN